MKFTMEVKDVMIESDVPAKNGKGTYSIVAVSYFDFKDQKVKTQKIFSFGNPQLFKDVSNMKPGDVFEVEIEKQGNFWQWVGLQKTSKPAAQAAQADTQLQIVRQSSLRSAVQALSGNPTTSKEEYLELAEYFTNYVFNGVETEVDLGEND